MKTIKKLTEMKTIYKAALILIVTISYTCTTERPVAAQGGYISFQSFYDQLSPYGEWIDYPEYGYVWVPNAGPDFEPYASNGYWVMTDYGWTWVSDYPWGWAPFHYGRWDFDRRIGWIWIPGNEWGPAWVSWRRANGYYGWAPLRPGITIGMSFNLGYRDDDHWCFVHERDFGRRDIYRYHIDRRDFEPFVRNTVVINNTYIDNRRNVTYVSGPRRDEVEKFTGRRINSMSVRNENRPGTTVNNNRLNIYRPRIQASGITGNSRPVPSRLSNINDIKPANERPVSPQRNVVIPRENNRNMDQQAKPERQAGRRMQETSPVQVEQQRQNDQLQNRQQDAQPQRQFQRSQNNQQNVQGQERSQQIQQNQKADPQQRREMRRSERNQKRIQQQQQSNQKQQNAAPQKSDQNKAEQQQKDQGSTGSGRRR
jgi:hypothetical protein